ncbi:uncharacterized protein AKAW2_80722A [Aspergillus luchuensis]|uniref:Uncharacterized protein n=1 Tax=Aspergillus kawachii TaxID=1069201 RepID=A0A146FQA8_ASPKA|nr:uncharacterized protein AKAW2_80722A [Aspergillus luchuensis]BCS04921.1 hypothetical protein AKAW2_80722A [Aspergillus luchuensis]GAT28094.1 hypothetical protein RIB2604_02501690 [Aspergillus luchuensis]
MTTTRKKPIHRAKDEPTPVVVMASILQVALSALPFAHPAPLISFPSQDATRWLDARLGLVTE